MDSSDSFEYNSCNQKFLADLMNPLISSPKYVFHFSSVNNLVRSIDRM